MKPILLLSALLCATLASRSQTPNTVIHCFISNARVDFHHLDKLLPASITDTLLVDPHKNFKINDGNMVCLWLEQHGWRLTAIDEDASGNGTVSTRSTYILTKEIYLDEA